MIFWSVKIGKLEKKIYWELKMKNDVDFVFTDHEH